MGFLNEIELKYYFVLFDDPFHPPHVYTVFKASKTLNDIALDFVKDLLSLYLLVLSRGIEGIFLSADIDVLLTVLRYPLYLFQVIKVRFILIAS